MPGMNVKNIRLRTIDFDINTEFQKPEKNLPISYRFSLQGGLIEDSNIMVVDISVETPLREQEPDYPFYFKVTVTGNFEFSEKPDEKLIEQFHYINCPGILFPYLREAVADITRRGGFPALHLPVTNFVKLKEQFMKGKK